MNKLTLVEVLISFAFWGNLKPKQRLKKVHETAKLVKKNPLDNSELELCKELIKSIKRKERETVIYALNVGVATVLNE